MSNIYEIKLSQYEGPLDLLLSLINKAKIEIKDIFVSEITEQYLAYISQEDMIDMELTSDFVQMAATLLYIKSRALLPSVKQEDIDEDGLSPEERLVLRLNEYKQFKTIAEALRVMEEAASTTYTKLPEELVEEPKEEVYLNANIYALSEEYLRLIHTVQEEQVKIPSVIYQRDHFSVRKQIEMIIQRLKQKPEITFYELLSEKPSKEEMAVTFLSMLELMNKKVISIEQKQAFGEIKITEVEIDHE